MTRIADVVPRDDARVEDEVVAVDVAFVAIAVVVLLRAVNLAFVDPHVVLQVGVFDHDAFVEHGDDDRLVARRGFPRLFTLHVGIDDRLLVEQVAAVDQVPLHRQQLVVEGIARIPGGTGRTLHGGEGLAGEGHRLLAGVVGTADRAVEVHVLDFAQGRKFLGDLLGGVVVAEAYDVPQVQLRFAGALFVAAVYGEDAFDLVAAHDVENLVDRKDARAGGGAAAAGRCGRLVEYLAHVRRKFDEYLPRLVLDRGVLSGAGRRELLVGAGGKCQECNGKNAV